MDEVLHDEEIVDVVGFFDDTDFVVEAFVDLLLAVILGLVEIGDSVEFFESGLSEMDEVALFIEAFRKVEAWEVEPFGGQVELKLDVAAVGNLDRVGNGFGLVGKEGGHLLAALHIELVAFISVARGIGHKIAALEADEYVVRLGMFLTDIVDIIGDHQRKAGAVGEFQYVFVGRFLILKAVILQL